MKFTTEEIRLLAQSERDMDSGKLAFVMLDGKRVSVTCEAMAYFDLKQGQTITLPIMIAILEFNIAQCEAAIEEQKFREQNP